MIQSRQNNNYFVWKKIIWVDFFFKLLESSLEIEKKADQINLTEGGMDRIGPNS